MDIISFSSILRDYPTRKYVLIESFYSEGRTHSFIQMVHFDSILRLENYLLNNWFTQRGQWSKSFWENVEDMGGINVDDHGHLFKIPLWEHEDHVSFKLLKGDWSKVKKLLDQYSS